MELSPFFALLGVLLFAGASFFFSLAETALFALSKWQVRQLGEKSPQLGGTVVWLLKTPQDLVATIALGNNVAAAAILSLALWMALGGAWNLALAALGALVVTLLFGEVLPKTLAVRAPELWSLRVAKPMAWLQTLSAPLRRLAQLLNSFIVKLTAASAIKPATVTDEDIHELLELAFQQGALAQSERDIILQIISLDRRTVREVMRPRAQMAAIPDDLDIEQMVAAARQHRHRRLPMYDGTPDTIVSVLNTRELLLNPAADLLDLVEFPSFVPETMNLLQLLKSLQRQKRGLAIVLDEFGSTAGVVTMEDILTEIIGQAHGDAEAGGFVMTKLAPGKWRVSGAMRLDDFRREHPALGEVEEIETMGGLLAGAVGVIPAVGESATLRGLKLTASAVDERRVRELIVEVVR